MNIVAIGAHQDDVELTCLGTLLLYRQVRETSIVIVTTSNGERGGQAYPDLSPRDIADVRRREAADVASALGGRYVSMELPDQFVRDSDEARNELTDIIREAQADVVLAPPPVDYHLDHMATSRLAFHTCLAAAVNAIATQHPSLSLAPVLYYVDSVAGLEFNPTTYVDIGTTFEEKCRLLQMHDSQMKSMKALGGWDLVEYAKVMNAFRGLQSGVLYAEAFRPAFAWPRVRAHALLPASRARDQPDF